MSWNRAIMKEGKQSTNNISNYYLHVMQKDTTFLIGNEGKTSK
jgi:hypothetical protein